MTLRNAVPAALSLLLLGPGLQAAGDPVVEGETFTPRRVTDAQLRGMTAVGFRAPAKWKDHSRVYWDLDNPNQPATIDLTVENAGDLEALYFYRPVQMYALQPDSNAPEGSVSFGLTKGRPRSPPQALWRFIQAARARAPKLKLVGGKELPDLARVLQVNYAKTQHGLGMKITYERDGKPVEEEFYAVHYQQEIPYDGPQGRTWQVSWGLVGVHSFRAPAGMLDKRRPVFGAIVKSYRANPAWVERVVAVKQGIGQRIAAQQQAGWDSIAAAGARSRAISANNDAMLAGIDQKLAADRAPRAGAAGGRSATDHFDDYLRGVDTTNDPYWGTSQHSSSEQHHWTDGYGSYRNSNDGSYDPNQHESGGWTKLQTE